MLLRWEEHTPKKLLFCFVLQKFGYKKVNIEKKIGIYQFLESLCEGNNFLKAFNSKFDLKWEFSTEIVSNAKAHKRYTIRTGNDITNYSSSSHLFNKMKIRDLYHY